MRRTCRRRALCCKAFVASATAAAARSASWPVITNTSALASSLRRRSHTPIECCRARASLVRSMKETFTPALRSRRSRDAIRHVAAVNSPESVGYLMSASTTVVSARTRSTSTSPRSSAAASSSRFNASISSGPQRRVSLRIVDSSGTVASSPMRQNRRQLIESATSTHSRS